MNDEMKSLLAAILLSAIVVLGVNHFLPAQPVDEPQQEEVQTDNNSAEQATDDKNTQIVYASVEETLEQDVRLPLKNNVISGSIRLKGARFDNIVLSKYKKTIDENSANIELMTPAKTENYFFAEYGWLSNNKNLKLPTAETLWDIEGNQELTPQNPITLVWDNGEGLKFINEISLDENYVFDIKQKVENNSAEAVTLIPYGLLSKMVNPYSMERSVVHEGFTAVMDEKLKEIRYGNIEDTAEKFSTTGGWASLSDKYWLASFVFDDNFKAKLNLRKIKERAFQLDFTGAPLQIQAGNSADVITHLYTGAKEIKLLDKYSDKFKKFDLNVDFGWYYFLTKPFFYILDFLYGIIGNMGWAILLFAFILRVFLFPIANKSYESMTKMKKVQPKLMVLQEMYKDDKAPLQRVTMDLYRREKINPAAGCLPMLIQIPIFFSLFKVLNIAIEIRHAPFIGWVKDLSAPDPLTISSWAHIYVPTMLDVGIWPIIYGLTMFLQNQLNPKPANKDQARMFALMPILFTLMFAHFAVGLVIYWILSNILSLIQQKIIMYKNGVK